MVAGQKHESLIIYEAVLFANNFFFCTQLAFLFHTQEDIYIIYAHIAAHFLFLDTFHEMLLPFFVFFIIFD